MTDIELRPDSIDPATLDELAHILSPGPIHINGIELPTPLREALLFIVVNLRAGHGIALRHLRP